MQFKRILSTIPFWRLKLTLIPLLVVDLILAPISIYAGKPSFWGIVLVNFLIILILIARFTFLFLYRIRCRSCGKGRGVDTGKDDYGYPIVRCPSCFYEWIL